LGIYGLASKNLINKISKERNHQITANSFGFSEDETIVEIDNGSHWLHFEKQEEVTSHIRKFYSKVDS